MSGVIFFEDRADQICARLGIGRESVRRIGLGLCYSDQGVDADLVHTTRGAGDDLAMSVLVEGQPMDVHGQGIPVPTDFGLRNRLDKWTESSDGDPIGTGEGVLIGVVDSGIVPNPWLTGGFLAAPDDFESRIAGRHTEPDDDSPNSPLEIGHGTFATGLILQQAPAAGVWVERALGADGTATARKVLEKAETLARRGVDILNLSLGAFADDPAALPWGVVAVGAVDRSGNRLAPWSNRGPWLDLAAPGTDLVSTYIDGCLRPPDGSWTAFHGWARWSGTSFATAVASGAIAAVMTGPKGPRSAEEAVYALRSGEYASGWVEADGDSPRIPVVKLRKWPGSDEAS